MVALQAGTLRLTVLALVLSFLFPSPELPAQPVNVDAAKKEGKVVVYGTVVPQVLNPINKGFEKKYGIRVEYWRGSATQVLDGTVTEWREGKPAFDVFEAP